MDEGDDGIGEDVMEGEDSNKAKAMETRGRSGSHAMARGEERKHWALSTSR